MTCGSYGGRGGSVVLAPSPTLHAGDSCHRGRLDQRLSACNVRLSPHEQNEVRRREANSPSLDRGSGHAAVGPQMGQTGAKWIAGREETSGRSCPFFLALSHPITHPHPVVPTEHGEMVPSLRLRQIHPNIFPAETFFLQSRGSRVLWRIHHHSVWRRSAVPGPAVPQRGRCEWR